MRRKVRDYVFADWLRAQLHARGWGVRTLARMIASPDRDIDVARRQLTRYLSEGVEPGDDYVTAIAAALEVDAAAIPGLAPKEEAA